MSQRCFAHLNQYSVDVGIINAQIDEPQRPTQRLQEPVEELYKPAEISFQDPTPASSVTETDSTTYRPASTTSVQARTATSSTNVDSKTPLLTPETLPGSECHHCTDEIWWGEGRGGEGDVNPRKTQIFLKQSMLRGCCVTTRYLNGSSFM